MKVWICVMVVDGDGDGDEPCVETKVATSEREACLKLLELWDDSPWEENWDPFSLAKDISGDGCDFYVEEHELQAVPMTEQEKCVVPGTMRINDRPLSDFIAQL